MSGENEQLLVAHFLLLDHPTGVDYGADEIIEAICSQPDPWRTRFLQLAAKAVSRNGDGRVPERGEVETWLAQSRRLRQQMAALLRAWDRTGSRRLLANVSEI